VAASQEQKVDYLLKKLGYSSSKTGIAEDESNLSGTKKAPFAEPIPSPLVVSSSNVWAFADKIPTTPGSADPFYVTSYLATNSGLQLTSDNTVADNRTFLCRSTYNNNTSDMLGDWIDTSYSADYNIEVYKGDPNSGGVKLSAAGSGVNDTWFFDYAAGVLNFNGDVVPSGVTSSNIYIVGYRYVGPKGIGDSQITNILYVTKDGRDENTGTRISDAKATIKSAVSAASTIAGSVVKVSAGTYLENNPIKCGPQISVIGDSLREVTIVPQNADSDLFHLAPGDYFTEMSFTGTMNAGKAIFAFDPDVIRYSGQSPYLRNCTNFVSNSIGMKIDGNDIIGPFKSFVTDSYTQYNQNGIGVSISNEGYAQIVSLFTINNDIGVICESGGQCDITNSNSSFGNFGLVADGIGSKQFTGIISATSAVNADTFTLHVDRADPISITNAVYDGVTGLTTITTASNHGYNVGAALTIANLKFTCDSAVGTTNYNVSAADYDAQSGVMTVTTSANHDFTVGIAATLRDFTFNCNSGGGASNGTFPPAPGAGNGAPNHVFDVISVPASNQFVVNVGFSTIIHTYVSGGVVGISTISNFPSGNNGYVFSVKSVLAPNQFTVHVGPNDREHTYVEGGTVDRNIVIPYDGQVVYFDELYNTVGKITITNAGSGYNSTPTITIGSPSESWGITASAVPTVTNGFVTGVEILSEGRGYETTPTITFSTPDVGINTATATIELLPTYYSVKSSTPISAGISTVTFNNNLPYSVGIGTTVPFFKQSRVLASSHSFEYIGSGTDPISSLPSRGGVTIQDNEVDNRNGGLVIYTSTDQGGNFRIGEGVVIDQVTGTISGNFYSKSLFANVTPLILALGGE
tara:strand:- start:3449 stop:6034 length:2586 start_codon:yes stop_codon:yes gene_type:complete